VLKHWALTAIMSRNITLLTHVAFHVEGQN